MDAIAPLYDWLVDGAPGAKAAEDVIEGLGNGLCEAGVPVDRVGAFVKTLHPQVVGRAFTWNKGSAVAVRDLTLELQQAAFTTASPVARTMGSGAELRRRLTAESAPEFPVTKDLLDAGFTDYVCMPMRFLSGDMHAMSFATKAPHGFMEEHLAALRRVLRPLARLAEILALRRTAANLLSTYVGRNAGGRILAGRILKGDIETIRAIIWFSDLRGFTAMSSRMTPRAIIDNLNQVFDCQVAPIEARGGEVLKFMGDGLLAIFPVDRDADLPKACAAALDAADEAFTALQKRNEADREQRLRFGLALHVGEVAYGNIGGSSRLDFTAIGPAVNLASRLEGLTSRLGRPVVLSEELARSAPCPLVDLGTFELKGVAGSQRVFATTRTSVPPAGSGS